MDEKNNEIIDAVIFSIPPVILLGPHLAPALLKAYCEEQGFRVKCINPSMDLFDSLDVTEKSNWPYNDFETIYENQQESLTKVLDTWIDQILECNPRIVGLSTHAWSSVFFVRIVAARFKERYPEKILILGGPPVMEVGKALLEDGKIDYFVSGDGEEALVGILKGQFDHPNINASKPKGISNTLFNKLPLPDFSDTDFDKIKARYPGRDRIYLIGSRGCVFSCSFCNVPSMTEKFRVKFGETFAKEVIAIQQKYDPSFVELADSILNGSMSIYREFLQALIHFGKQANVKPQLDAFFRCRPAHVMKPRDFELSAQAGMKRFRIGVESGSQAVRDHMGKKETNEDIFYTLEMCLKYGIGVNLLLIAGYPTETESRFQETMDFLAEIRRRGLDKTVDTVVVNELYISDFTPLRDQVDELNIKNVGNDIDEKAQRYWTRLMEDGVENNSELRMKRVFQLKNFVKENFRSLGKVLIFSSQEDSWEAG